MSEETRKILKELEVGTTYSGVDVICRQYKEIERLNNIINDMDKQIDNLCNNQKREVERLNNIINELEDYLNKIKDTSTLQERMTAKFLLKYIKELKGVDKE